MTLLGIEPRSRLTRIVSTAQKSVATRIRSRPSPADAIGRQDQRLADEEDAEADDRRDSQALAEERDGQQGDPHEQGLLDEGGAGCAGLGETGEEEDERHAATNHANGEDGRPVPPLDRPDVAGGPESQGDRDQDERGDRVLQGRVHGGVRQLLDRKCIEVDGQPADERGTNREDDAPADSTGDGDRGLRQSIRTREHRGLLLPGLWPSR